VSFEAAFFYSLIHSLLSLPKTGEKLGASVSLAMSSYYKGLTQPWVAVQAFHSVAYICSLPSAEFTESCLASTTAGIEAFSGGFQEQLRRSLSSSPVLVGRAVEHMLDSLIIDWRNWRLINTLLEWERYKEEKENRRVSSRRKMSS